MSLLVINDTNLYHDDPKLQETFLKSIALNLPGTTNICVPRSIEEYADKVHHYRPRNVKYLNRAQNLVILGGIDEYLDPNEADIGYYRLHDLYTSHKGGVIIGDKPSYNSVAYKPNISPFGDMEYLTSLLQYNANFSLQYNMKSSMDYMGRGDSFPRVILYGFGLDYPRISMGGLTILGGLAEYDNFWHNVAWFRTRTRERQRKVMDRISNDLYPNAARIAITEKAHELLTEDGIDHVYIPGRPGKAKTFTERQKYGSLIFEEMLNYYERE